MVCRLGLTTSIQTQFLRSSQRCAPNSVIFFKLKSGAEVCSEVFLHIYYTVVIFCQKSKQKQNLFDRFF